jgi:hypothetical protein
MARLPDAGDDVATRLTLTPVDGQMRWTRSFGSRTLTTQQRVLPDGRVAELYGIVECALRLEGDATGITYDTSGARLCLGGLRVPLPRPLSPRIRARAEAKDGAMRVAVRLSVPLLGTILEYEGDVAPDESPA